MKTYQKFLFAAVLGILIVPQVTFAAWWNPLSWGIFSSIFHTQSQTEITTTPSPSTDTTASSSVKASISTETPTPAPIKTSPKVSSPTVTPKPPVTTKVPQQTQPSGTLCNGTYWNSCPAGQNLVCPTSGDAYCQAPQQPVQPVQQKDNYQICRDSYGHATWDGSSYTSSGGPNCSCDTGYGPSADGASCVAVQATQPVQQVDYSINNSACQTATQNLENLQTGYANGYAGLSTSGTSNIAAQLSAIFTNQYKTELPAYQMAAQAACKIPASNSQCQAAITEFNTFQAQYPIKQLVGMSTRGDAFALRFPPYETKIYYACQ